MATASGRPTATIAAPRPVQGSAPALGSATSQVAAIPATPTTTRSGASTAAPGHDVQALQKPSPAVRTANQARVHPPLWTKAPGSADGRSAPRAGSWSDGRPSAAKETPPTRPNPA